MNRIRLLPEHVANQIAAGEVVERPASVVKELVENSLDAQARHITVDVQAGGRSVIRITDDGSGMSRDDALLCLERHATSKIQRAEDLSAISTMGFRGEAVPSIASVSRMVLTTRERDAENPAATQIVINGGKLLEVRAAGSPAGTSVEVRQLFFNLPARRFLRTRHGMVARGFQLANCSADRLFGALRVARGGTLIANLTHGGRIAVERIVQRGQGRAGVAIRRECLRKPRSRKFGEQSCRR